MNNLLKKTAFVTQYYIRKFFYLVRVALPLLRKAHVNTFPAIHLRKIGWMDIFVKFSSELTVVGLALLVTVLNLAFMGSGKNFADKSFSARLLSYHTALNPKYYSKLTSISTVMVADGGFFTKAHADDFTGLSGDPLAAAGAAAANADSSDYLTSDGVMVKPDISPSELIAKQIKVYQTLPGDTLRSIGQAFGVSPQTLVWANNLSATAIKPGWFLLVPPVDGIIVKADANTTLPDIANKYSTERYNPSKQARNDAADKLLQTIISYNGLANAEDIDAGQIIVVPGGVVALPPQAKIAPKARNSPVYSPDAITSISSGYDGNSHYFPKGYCTYYVANKMKITFGGNAKNWLANAKASGYVTGTGPAAHSAVVMTGPKGAMRRYGHVAYVDSVNGDGTVTISEMNYDHFNQVDTRVISVHDSSIRGYIYP